MVINAVFHPLHVLVVIFLLSFMNTLSFGSIDDKTMRCIEVERQALMLFNKFLWNPYYEEDCCKWESVGCDNLTGHVTQLHLSSRFMPYYAYYISDSLLGLPYLNYLDLSSNSLKRIPDSIGSLTNLVHLDLSDTHVGNSSLPHQIGNLSNLQYLDLSFNDFDGPIPKFIGSLNSLRYLDLSNNSFEGIIPHELGNLSKLKYLNLSSYISDYPNVSLSVGNSEWLFNLSSLTHLDLSGKKFASPTAWASFIQRMSSISVMRLERCNLSAPSTSLTNFSSSISVLQLGGNYITSSIFDWLPHLNGSLIGLDLRDNVLEGRIPNSFGLMTALTYVDLSGNQLNGKIPDFIWNLSNLEVIHFSSNDFTGSVPDFTLLPSLTELLVYSNKLNGYLPKVFEHQSALKILDLSNNHLRGSLPNFTGFSSLKSLYLSGNKFSGSLPYFSGCSSLQQLRLNENQLTKWETQSIGQLSSLEELNLSMNYIRSTIFEAHFSNLSSLQYLHLSSNFLTYKFSSEWLPPFQLRELHMASCKLGPKFPHWIQNQQQLILLDISNNQISDNIPLWFWDFSYYLSKINLSSNKFRGKLSNLGEIALIDLSSNDFDGPLPLFSEDCREIDLSQNNFSGTLLASDIPSYITVLDVSHNQLFGALPDFYPYTPVLAYLNLGYNNFSGRIPPSIGNMYSLRTLILRNNKLYGELPASLRNCRNLGFVDFGLNNLSGQVPSWIGEDLPNLYALILKSNWFYGSLPYEICHLSNLHFLDLSMNRISGNIPTCFDNFTAMIQKGKEVVEHTYYSEDPSVNSPSEYKFTYSDEALARWKGQEYEYGRNFAYLKMIDLSTNNLSGEIPIGITRLLELKGLNLSGNRFFGKVPPEIGQLKVLESLDLSTNKFSGKIPPSMSRLSFLAFLNLSNNNFSGKIPSGTQLQGFNTSTYEGNTGLCGKPLTNVCPGDKAAGHERPSSREYEVDGDSSEYKRWLCIGAVLGFSTSFWGIIGTLVLNRRWRHAYYLSLYNLKERFYVAMPVRIGRLQRNV